MKKHWTHTLIYLFFVPIILWLFYSAGFSTAVVSIHEKTYFLPDSIFLSLLISGVFLAVFWLCYQKGNRLSSFIAQINEDPDYYQNCKKRIIILWFLSLLLFVLASHKLPRADQYLVCDIARQWKESDFSSLYQGQYLDIYPNQLGIILILYGLSFFVGSCNYIFLQLLNVLAALFIVKFLVAISDSTGKKPFMGLCLMLACILFLPLSLYTTFVYGTLWGLAFALASFYLLITYQKTAEKHHLFFAVLLMFFAILVKNNYMIFALGLLFYAFIQYLKNKDKYCVFLCFGMVLSLLLYSPFVSLLTANITHIQPGKGSSKWSWVVMGFQENKNLCDGWYNGYNIQSFKDADYDSEKQQEIVREDISDIIESFTEDPMSFFQFISKKNTAQWNNPTFQGFWVNQVMHNGIFPSYRIYSLQREDKIQPLIWFLNYYQFFVLLGVLFYFILQREKDDPLDFYAIVLIGGFIFHTFWEAKSEYIFPYFILLLPIFIEGMYCFFQTLIQIGFKNETGFLQIREDKTKQYAIYKKYFLHFLIVLVMGISFNHIPFFHSLFFVKENNQKQYQQYVKDHKYSRIKSGNYRLILKNQDKETVFNSKVHLVFSLSDDHCSIQFLENQNYMIWNGNIISSASQQALKNAKISSMQWYLRKYSSKGFILEWDNGDIFTRNPRIVYDRESNHLTLSDKKENICYIFPYYP